MRTNHRARASAPAHLGFLLDELRSAGVTTYADLAATLNRQGIRPARGRWTAHDLHLAMRRHRHAHPAASLNAGAALYARRADEARRVMRRLQRRGMRTQAVIAPVRSTPGVSPRPALAIRGPHAVCRGFWRPDVAPPESGNARRSPRFIDGG